MKYCSQCGGEIADDATFCTNCGAPQVAETPVEAEAPEIPAAEAAPAEEPAQPAGFQQAQQQVPQQNQFQQQQYQQPPVQQPKDSGGIGWGLLGCCIPLVGLILFLVWKGDKPQSAKAAGIGAIVGVAISLVCYIISFAAGFAGTAGY